MFECRRYFNRLGLVSYFMVISSLIFFMLYRSHGVWSFVCQHTGRHEPVFLNIINNDAMVVGIVLLLLYLGFFNTLIKSIKWLAYLSKAVVIFITLFYAVDALLLLKIYKRLHYQDIAKYGLEIKAGLSFLAPVKAVFFNLLSVEVIGFVFAVIFLSFVLSFITLQFRDDHKKAHSRLLLISGFCFVLFSFFPMKRIYLHGCAYQNIFAYNMPKGFDQQYPSGFITALEEKGEKRKKNCEGLGKRHNIILLIVESLSSCQSKFFSGLNNFTPRLDEIAKENISFTNFFANGSTTEQGLIALLLGKVPLIGVDAGSRGAFKGHYQCKSLATLLKEADYETYFLTTGDLSFTNKGAWLEQIGFDVIEGSKTSFYKGWPKFSFNAAPDEALYAYAIKKILEQNSNKRPYFMVLETVSSHLPFIDPEGLSNTEKSVFTYVDRQLGLFYRKLEDLGFFSNGMLIITSDHRIMAPLSSAELDIYGGSAFARIPMVVALGGKRKGVINTCFQQTDLYSSLEWFVAKQYKKIQWDGNFLHHKPEPPFCILTHTANDFDLVYARCGLEEGYIKLEGDKTRLVRRRIDPKKLPEIIEKINRIRIFRDKE